MQSESALRNMALSYPYDAHAEGEISLRSHTAEIALHLKTEIQERLWQAGVEVLEARISHLAYAPEIAHAMLQRQQAGAVIAARQKIVEGAVGMVEMALQMLSHQNIVELDNDRKATMVSNLLVDASCSGPRHATHRERRQLRLGLTVSTSSLGGRTRYLACGKYGRQIAQTAAKSRNVPNGIKLVRNAYWAVPCGGRPSAWSCGSTSWAAA